MIGLVNHVLVHSKSKTVFISMPQTKRQPSRFSPNGNFLAEKLLEGQNVGFLGVFNDGSLGLEYKRDLQSCHLPDFADFRDFDKMRFKTLDIPMW